MENYTDFNCTMIFSSTKEYKVDAKIEYGGTTNNTQKSTYTPIKRKKPIIIDVCGISYKTGSISILVVADKIQIDKRPNRLEATIVANDLCDFLENEEMKILKDWNGNSMLVKFSNCSISYDGNYGNGILRVNGQWTEQKEV